MNLMMINKIFTVQLEQEEFAIKNQRFFLSILTTLSVISFFLCVLAISNQFPFYQLSKIISNSLIIVFIFSIPFLIKNFLNSEKSIKYLFIFNILCLILLLVYSIFVQRNDISLAIRFFSIFVLLLAAFFLPPKKIYVNIFLILAVLHSVVLIVFEIYLVLLGDPAFAASIRAKVMSLGLGDVYTYNQYFYRIQVKGNPVLPIAFLVSLFAIRSKRIKISVGSLLLVGTIVAGNFAYLLSIVFFVGMYCIILFFSNQKVSAFLKNILKSQKTVVLTVVSFLFIIVIAVTILYPYLQGLLQRKMLYSIPTRFDQVILLIQDLMETKTTLLFGQGLGNILNVITDFRDYRNAYYYELQTIYILNQVGVIYFAIFIATKIIYIIKFWRNKVVYILYLSYVIYAFTNPYLFDTTNIMVLIVLSSLNKLYLKEGNNSEI